jgi:hypothetical protein
LKADIRGSLLREHPAIALPTTRPADERAVPAINFLRFILMKSVWLVIS